MESYLHENFEIQYKNSPEEALRRWRSAVSIVKNRRRRFRMTTDLNKRSEIEQKKLSIQEKIRIAPDFKKAALQFIDAGIRRQYEPPPKVRQAGFYIDGDKLADMVRNHDKRSLKEFGGVEGIARTLAVKLEQGVGESELALRQEIFGSNQYIEKPSRSFWTFIWGALQDLTLIILMICAIISVGLGIATEGWPMGMYDGLGIILCILLVVIIIAISNYKQYLQFRDMDKEKNKTFVRVTRDGYRKNVSINDLVVGDIVDLFTGDQVPADGFFIYGFNLLIDESSLSGESDPVEVCQKNPFLLSGTEVQDGSCKMLLASVGMRTHWGSMMQTLSEWGEDETPMQVKLNGIATIIAKIGLAFSVLIFMVLMAWFLVDKVVHNKFLDWSSNDALKLLNYFAIAVTIFVIAVPEGLPLAVTLSRAYAMKQLMNDKALMRHLSACESMGSSTCICTDKTGTLTANHMVVEKIWICEETEVIGGHGSGKILKSTLYKGVLSILLQSIFQNTGSDVVKGKDGKNTIFGTPTESALLEFGLLLGGNFDAQRREAKIVIVEPFNSARKKMSMLVTLPTGMHRAFCSGAPEIIIQMCDKMIESTGSFVCLSDAQVKNVKDVINSFACDALRILCLAFKDMEETSCRDSIPTGGYTLIAVVGIKNPVRPGVKDAVQTCLAAGINVKMVTGDNINTAKAVAKECGILTDDGLAIEGPEFRSKSPQEMNELIPKIQVLARSLPLDKHMLVTQLRKFGEVVAVTGDGANDALALHESDIGLVMGIAGTKVAKENADVIIMDDNFKTIVNVAKWGRAVYINIQKFVQFQLTVNAVALMINFVSACLSGSAPLTVVQLLWVNMIMDTLGALALGTEPPNDELMKRSPFGMGVNFITRTMWRNIIGQSIYQLTVLGVLEFYGKQLLKLNASDASSVLNTFIFNIFVFCQVFNEINSREMEKINVFRGMFDSWIFLIVMVSTVAFQIIMVEFLGAFASTVPLSWQLWLLSILIGSISMIVAVIVKCIPVEPAKHTVTERHHDGYEGLPCGPELE